MEIDIQAFEAQLYREVYGTPAPWETEFDAFDAARLIAHHDDLAPWERPAVPSYEEVEDDQPTPTPEPEVQPAQEPRVRRRGRAPRVIEGIMVGGVDADALWTAYAEANPECASLRQRRSKWAAFCEWCRDNGEVLDAGTLDRYAASMLERGVSKASVSVYLCYVRAVLRHGIASGMLPDGCAPKRRGGGRRKKAARPVIPYLEARRCLPYLGDMQSESASAARIKKKKKSYKKRFLADLFRLDFDFDAMTVRKAYRKLAVYLHPDHGGDAEKMRALTDAYTWLTTDLQASVYKLAIFVTHSAHALVEAFSRDIYERIGGYQTVDELWERIDAQTV